MALDLKKLRKKMGITQADLAQLIGVTSTFISQVERKTSNLNSYQYRMFQEFSALKDDFLSKTKEFILEGGYLFALSKLLNEVYKKGK